jgi:hypothetical protein
MKLGGPQSQPTLGGVHLVGVEPPSYPAHIWLLCWLGYYIYIDRPWDKFPLKIDNWQVAKFLGSHGNSCLIYVSRWQC